MPENNLLIWVCLLSIVPTLGAILPFFVTEHWSIRVWDFARFQLFLISCLFLAILFLFVTTYGPLFWHCVAILIGSIMIQSWKISPYTKICPKQVLNSDKNYKVGLSIMISNVLMKNRNSSHLLKTIKNWDPDIVLLVETDNWWAKNCEKLKDVYLFNVTKPLNNTYGMMLFSKKRIVEFKINDLVEKNVPSIFAKIELNQSTMIQAYFIHPKPPFPTEAKSSLNRDVELIIVGKKVKEISDPILVAGDLNDVAWSRTTKLFQKLSGLLDPRRGRGFYSTYNAKNPLLRWPLDHLFHSKHFKLDKIKRLNPIGSDHFPMYVSLSYEPSIGLKEQDSLTLERNDIELMKKKVKAKVEKETS